MKDNILLNVHRGGTPGKTDPSVRDKELFNCNFVKFVLMLLVVLNHSVAYWTGNWFDASPVYTSRVLDVFSGWLDSFHIYGFALVSGYIFFYLRIEKERYSKFRLFLCNKAKRLLVPYVFVVLAWVIPVQWLFFRYDLQTILVKYILGTSPNQLWFLLMLFSVFIMFWLLTDFFVKHDLGGLVLVLGMFGTGVLANTVLPNVYCIWTALQYMPLFWLGFKMRQYGTDLLRKVPTWLFVVVNILLFAISLFLENMGGGLIKILRVGVLFMLHVAGALMAFIVLQRIAERSKWNTGFFRWLNGKSMVVYLLHQQVIYFSITWLNGVVGPYLNATVNFIAAMGISVFLATLLMRFKLTRFLVGEKQQRR